MIVTSSIVTIDTCYVEGHQFSKLMARKIKKINIMTQSQKVLKTKKFKKIIEKNDDVKVRHYIRIILVSLNFLRPQLEGVATQIWVATHYLRTPGLDKLYAIDF